MVTSGSIRWLNGFDINIELWLNSFSGHHPWFDQLVVKGDSTNLTTSVVIVLLLWLAVFDARRQGRLRDRHEMIFGAAFFAMVATLVARAIAITLPFRARPMATPSLHLKLPDGGSLVVIHWSSFPSDHAALFFALAVGILPVSKRLGWFAIGWVVAFVCLPLLYLGVHWPTDIIAGAAIGAGSVQCARIPAVRAFFRRNVELLYANRPPVFFSLFFLWSYETTVLFEDVRRVLFFFARTP